LNLIVVQNAMYWKFTPNIIAPLNQFCEGGQMHTQGYKLGGKEITAQDPIILQRVVRGYLIVTAWGDEAADPIVVNPKNN